jgi:hypothetical protein
MLKAREKSVERLELGILIAKQSTNYIERKIKDTGNTQHLTL